MPREVTRHIKDSVSNMLWGRAAGRCQFDGCNRLLSRSPVTQESVNIAERAHIWSFSDDGPRGNEGADDESLNDLGNLMLVCHDCHRKMDNKKDGGRYTVELLQSWKTSHEHRVEVVTGINPSKRSHVLMYGANVGDQAAPLDFHLACTAMFPNRYPAEAQPIRLGMVNSAWRDRDAEFWKIEATNLDRQFSDSVSSPLARGLISHLSVFAFAPQALLMRLGASLTDIPDIDVFQLRREPRGWQWATSAPSADVIIDRPTTPAGPAALVVGVSATIVPDRIRRVLGRDTALWTVRVPSPHNDWLCSRDQLRALRRAFRQVFDEIKAAHGQAATIHVFPAMPIAAAVEFGRVRMPKADAPMLIYDQVNERAGFVPAITLGGGEPQGENK
ncbi:MAG: SAVED domain-containing protein [Phycisphaeraceae bacterium]|nr:MAG: SAVED domain-containing protein [Phycisphaeraceae bacterium]